MARSFSTPISSSSSYTGTSFDYAVPTASESAKRHLEADLFVRAEELLTKIVMATRVGEEYTWVTLDPKFHSLIVKTAVTLVNSGSSGHHPVAAIKVALFSFLLDILNGRPQDSFFARKEIKHKANRANRERKRLARKRSRAAKRERDREAKLLAGNRRLTVSQTADGTQVVCPPGRPEVRVAVTGQTRTCTVCSKKFASRKKLSKHKCTGQLEAKEGPTGHKPRVVTDAKRARRAKARKARRVRVKEAKVAERLRMEGEYAAAKKLHREKPVTGSSVESCEDCDRVATGAIHHGTYRYPKCTEHGSYRSEFKFYRECETCPGSPFTLTFNEFMDERSKLTPVNSHPKTSADVSPGLLIQC
ncbi:hypothetical protein JOM56_007970 [Amanita muscaria]